MKKKLTSIMVGSLLLLGFASGASANSHGDDRNCEDFSGNGALEFWYQNDYSAGNDPHGLDGDGDGIPCEVPEEVYNEFIASKEQENADDSASGGNSGGTSGAGADSQEDRDCDHFASHEEALAFWNANGYSADNDPHRLDRDGDGIPCEDDGSGQPEDSEDAAAPLEQPAGTDTDSTEGEALPDTATNNPFMMLMGAGVAAAGSLLVFRRKGKEVKA